MISGAAISYSSKLQSMFALPTFEAEYLAMCEAEKRLSSWDIYWSELGFRKRATPVTLHADNRGSIVPPSNQAYRRTISLDSRSCFKEAARHCLYPNSRNAC